MSKVSEPGTPVIPTKYRNPIMHDRGPSNYIGDYQVTDAALKRYGVARDHFGTTRINITKDAHFRVKDYQYTLPDNSIGMRFLPVNDYGPIDAPGGRTAYGSDLVDELLRTEMGLKDDDPIYALIYYFHPDLNDNSIAGFATTEKMEMGITHVGAYLGKGRTSNSPALYHDRRWGVKGDPGTTCGYPANVMTLSINGVDQATLNKNLVLVDRFLNNDVRFPVEYKSNKFRAVDVNTALMFYKDWISEKTYLKTDVTWFTYCAAHKTLVSNIACNLPHNLDSFKEIYGENEGADFYQLFCDHHYQLTGWPFDEKDTTHFEPLWKQEGLTAEQIKPLTREEYEAYDKARRAGELTHFKGYMPQPPNSGTPWPPQMVADVILDFVQTYGDFLDAGAIAASATTYGFVGPATERARISKVEYMMKAVPIVQHILEADARVQAAKVPAKSHEESAYYKETFAALCSALGGDKKAKPVVVGASDQVAALKNLSWLDKLKELTEGWEPEVLTWFSLMRVRDHWSNIMEGGCVEPATAYVNMMDAIQDEFESARDVVVKSPDGIQYYAPPAILHMIGDEMFAANEHIMLRPVVTVMDYTELELKGN